MTANQSRYGYNTNDRYSARMSGHAMNGYAANPGRQTRADGRMRQEEPPVMYIYGDRICRKESKQRQLYKTFGTAAGYKSGNRGKRYAGGNYGTAKKQRYKIVIENIINLFDSIDERRRQDVEAAKRNAIMKKKFLEHRRGLGLALFMITFLVLISLLIYHVFFGIRSIYAENTVNYRADEVVAASGISVGDRLYSFRADDAENRITFRCPYIRSAEVTRTVPNRVSIALESDKGVYYADVYGEKLVLSAGLRVLGAYDTERDADLIRLYLPEIRYSVAGRVIAFAEEKQDRFVRDMLAAIGSSGLAGRIDMADLRSAYDITMYCDGMYLMKFGGEKDMVYKLKLAEKTVAHTDFNAGTPAEIDLSIPGEASVRYDHNLRLDSAERK